MTNNIGILIIEDDISFAIEMEMMVVDLGYKFLGNPKSSTEALEAIANQKPDIIITDIGIQGTVDGVTLIESIGLKKTPVIFITGFKDEHYFNRAKKTPHSTYLIKPFHLLTLRSAIEKSILNLQELTDKQELAKAIFVRNNNMLHKVNITEIKWIEVDGNYCYLFVEEKKHVVKTSLKKMLQNINQQDIFLRVHRNFVIQQKYITNFNSSNNTILIFDTNIPVGRKYKNTVLSLLKNT